MPLRYVGKGAAYRRLPAEDLTDEVIAAAAARSLQGANDLTQDLLASGLYAVDTRDPVAAAAKAEAKAKSKAARKAKENTMTETPKNDGKASKAVEDSSVEAEPEGEVLTTDEAIDKLEEAPEKE